MSKPFNIHDWQAKQKQLSEIKAQDVPGTAAFMGKNMRSGGMSNSEKNKASVDAFFKDLRDKEKDSIVAKGDGIEITQDEMDKLHRDGRVRLKDGSLLVFPSKPLNVKEAIVDYDFSKEELIRVIKQLKRGASTEIEMIKAFEKALGRELTDDEIRGFKLKKDPDYIKKLNAKNAKKDVAEAKNPELLKRVNRFIKKLADDNSYSLQAAVNAIMGVLRSQNYDGVNEHHGDDFPKDLLDKKVSSFLDDLKKKTKEGPDYETVEDIMKKHFSIDEMNSLGSAGAGASFQAGDGDAYATPNAFGDDKKKKMKTYKSIGYKKV